MTTFSKGEIILSVWKAGHAAFEKGEKECPFDKGDFNRVTWFNGYTVAEYTANRTKQLHEAYAETEDWRSGVAAARTNNVRGCCPYPAHSEEWLRWHTAYNLEFHRRAVDDNEEI